MSTSTQNMHHKTSITDTVVRDGYTYRYRSKTVAKHTHTRTDLTSYRCMVEHWTSKPRFAGSIPTVRGEAIFVSLPCSVDTLRVTSAVLYLITYTFAGSKMLKHCIKIFLEMFFSDFFQRAV